MPATTRPITKDDFERWNVLFHGYVAFYKMTLPEEQYTKTFARLIDPNTDLYGLVLIDSDEADKVVGFAHFFPHQTPLSEKKVMHLNDLFVDPACRSKGYGRQLIQAAGERAKADGCSRLEWATQHGNPARKLYDQLGSCDFVEYRMPL